MSSRARTMKMTRTAVAVMVCILCVAISIYRRSIEYGGEKAISTFITRRSTRNPGPDIRSSSSFTVERNDIHSFPLVKDTTTGVRLRPAKHPANPLWYASDAEGNETSLLRKVLDIDDSVKVEVISSSFKKDASACVITRRNGFVSAAVEAYSSHHHLHIYPEDIWLAILTQLSSYINAHAEELRGSFVSHQGQKELRIVYDSGNRYTVDWAEFAHKIGLMIEDNVVDPEIRSWMMPAFSTTTQHDIVVASIVMMASMQKYFTYACSITCGIPTVTLHGKQDDYEIILQRLDKLRSYGTEPADFARYLKPIIRRFIRSFDTPDDAEIESFWNRIFSEIDLGSGPIYWSGWITAFLFWNVDGVHVDRLPWLSEYEQPQTLVLDDVSYPPFDSDADVPGFSTVPVQIDDYGPTVHAMMLAGSIGMDVGGSGNMTAEGVEVIDALQPRSAWWLYEIKKDG